ncbi:MAG: hypothetical protein Sapg2KO_26540 [Saprospiraceae bacterium]
MKKKRSILLVKNDPVIAADLLRYVQKWEYEIYAEHDNMLDAILSIQKDPLKLPDVLLVDLPFVQQEAYFRLIKIFLFLYPVAVIIISGTHTCECGRFEVDLSKYLLPLPFSEVQLQRTLSKAG